MLAVGALGYVLSLGPDGVRPVYSALHRFVFGFSAIRAPARFSVLVIFALSVPRRDSHPRTAFAPTPVAGETR
jgi:hypothetical protein